jgi:hypothetical protein
MKLSETSKRVEAAVEEAHALKQNISDYSELAVALDELAEKHGLPVKHVRTVSGIELNSIDKVIRFKETGDEEKFVKAFNKLEHYDQERVIQELKSMEIIC